MVARPGAPDEVTVVPLNHRELVEVYDVGCFDDFLWIYGEGVGNPHLERLSDLLNRLTVSKEWLIAPWKLLTFTTSRYRVGV